MEQGLKSFLKQVKLNESTISTVLGAVVVILVGLLIFNYFKQAAKKEQITPEAAQEENKEGTSKSLPATHKVVAGEDLWQIAQNYYGSGYNWVDIADTNKLADPNLIYPDQELNIPKVEVRNPDQATTQIKEEVYKVKEGDNLWQIAIATYADGYRWPDIAKVNNLTDPNFIEVGQELKLPK
jgi:nucleoid-associated protein YgaU